MMDYGTIPGLSKPVSRIIHGSIMANSKEQAQSFVLLDAVFEQGINTFDTAHVYGNGDNERTVGAWIRERGIRDQVVIVAKGAHHNADRQRVTPFDITADIHDTLARFKTDHLDIYLLHRDDPSVPVGPIVEVLNEHHRAGRIGPFGGSNWAWERVQAANAYAAAHGLVPFTISSPNYSLADMVKEPWENCISIAGAQGIPARQWYAAQQMPLFTWSSLAGGFFSGRFAPDNLEGFTDYFDVLVVNSYCSADNFTRLERARALAASKSVSVAQVAVAWVLGQPREIYALLAARTAAECQQNIQALHLTLTPAELDWLNLVEGSLPA
jgi:aryl-alcohol dehydrogenase-like predicted oxidoreductase